MNEEKEIAKGKERSQELQTEAVEPEAAFVPLVDVIEKQDGVEILADMPGVSRENVEASLEEGVLTISGKVSPPTMQGMSLQSGEYETGSFYRSFAVGEGLDTEGIEASMKDGVLRLRIPKSEKYKPKQIEIR